MTEILDSQGNTIRVGARVLDLCPACGGSGDPPDDLSGIAICRDCGGTGFAPGGTVTHIGDPDGDTDSYGRVIGIAPTVTVRYDDGDTIGYAGRWNATGPWDDHRDDYTCDDLTVDPKGAMQT